MDRLRQEAEHQVEQQARRSAVDFGRWRNDPNGYIRHHLGQFLTPDQEQIGKRLTEPPYRVLIPAAHKVGKTHWLGGAVQWHHDCHDPGIVLCTAPTKLSLTKQLFREIRNSRPGGRGLMPQANEIRHTERHFVLGMTAGKAEAFQGKHEQHQLFVFDEATGINWVFWDRVETMFKSQPGFGWVCAYNPYDPTCEAYFAEQSGAWHVVRLSALTHPNMVAEMRGLPPVVPAAVQLDTVVKRIAKECEILGERDPEDCDDSCFEWPPPEVREQVPENAGPIPWAWYRACTTEFEVQILGRWPSKAFDAVWGAGDWKRAMERPCELRESWPVQIGCDVARGGVDKVGIAVRKGAALLHLELFSVRGKHRPSLVIADRLRDLCRQWARHDVDPRTIPVAVDDSGGYGSGVIDYPEGFNFIGVSAAEKALDESKYPNKRAELWWTLRLAADAGLFCPSLCREGKDLLPMLAGDLQSARYALDRKARRVVESKDAIKARLKRSPDLADAACLAWYPATA